MALAAEDPAAVLEQFIHDVANLPAEVAHLFEEAQAKQEVINECCTIISSRDTNLQRFIKQAGSLTVNPKEEQYSKVILENFERAQHLQEEKVALIQKASTLLDRYVKRLDIKIRDLQTEGSMPADPQMPTLLRDSPGNLVPPASSVNTGANTPLQPLPINTIGGSSNIANAAIAQLQRASAVGRMGSSATVQPHPLLNSSHLVNAPAIAAMNLAGRRDRETSAGALNRRRQHPGHINMPPHSSNLVPHPPQGNRTPKASTPGAPRSRAGSADPRPRKNPQPSRRPDPRQQRRKAGKSGISKKSRVSLLGSSRASPATTNEDSGVSDDGSEDENGSFHAGEEMYVDDEGTDDLTKYCYCHKISYGDMVACDNSDCKGQWFHWDCAGLTSEPLGEWLCRDCSKLPRNKIKKG